MSNPPIFLRTIRHAILYGAIGILLTHSTAMAEYYLIPVKALVPEYKTPEYQHSLDFVSYGVFGKDAETWIGPTAFENFRAPKDFQIAIQVNEPIETLSGTIYLSDVKGTRLDKYEVTFELAEHVATEEDFYHAIELYYQRLVDRNFSGKLWFQTRLEHAIRMQGLKVDRDEQGDRFGTRSIDRTFAMFSGTRAITENTQLDRQLNLRGIDEATVDVDSINGITIAEFDWKARLKDVAPDLDTLAERVPYDQHVVFLDSLASVVSLFNETNSFVMPAFSAFAASSSDELIVPTYLSQMRIDLNALSKQDFTAHIEQIAITGSDPYSELGTDIGIVLKFDDDVHARAFATFLFPESFGEKRKRPALIDGIPDSTFVATDDRRQSTYLILDGQSVMLSNSPRQIRKLKNCRDGKLKSLVELDDYRFFRHRYPRAADETAFVFMSDAAIRRWCSAKWRIGQSRRIRATMRMNKLQAELLPDCVAIEQSQQKELTVDHPSIDQSSIDRLGKLSLTSHGIRSEKFGTISFVTPIAEMDLQSVTVSEQQAYERWRDGYQRNWSAAFDPIGIQMKIKPESISTDITVMPLILSSQFRQFAKAKPFAPGDGDRHTGSLAHAIFATADNDQLPGQLKGLQSVEAFVDDSDIWQDFVDSEQADKFFQKNINKIPLAVTFSFERAEQMETAVEWAISISGGFIAGREKETHRGIDYIRSEVSGVNTDKFDLYRYQHDSRVVFSLSEKTIKQAIDRTIARKKGDIEERIRDWQGQSLAIQTNADLFRVLELFSNNHMQTELKKQTWRNLPILNEWKRNFPDQDPVAFHRRFWNQQLLCTGGGELVWDEKLKAMKSTKFGSPADPRFPMGTPFPWRQFKTFDAGVTVEEDGLRAKLLLTREK